MPRRELRGDALGEDDTVVVGETQRGETSLPRAPLAFVFCTEEGDVPGRRVSTELEAVPWSNLGMEGMWGDRMGFGSSLRRTGLQEESRRLPEVQCP